MNHIPRKNISIIVAVADNWAIGKNNQLLFHLPDDLKRFKKITSEHSVIMGKKTFFSLPKGPLPNRKNIVISDNSSDSFEGCEMAYSIEEAINKMEDEKENFIIGGGMIYNQFLPLSNKLYLTKVHLSVPDADTFFPEINFNDWQLTEQTDFPATTETPAFSYCVYSKNN